MADPRRMTPEEHGEAHALLVKAVTDPDRQAANKALEELMRKLVVVHRLLEAEGASPARAVDRPDVTAAGSRALYLATGPRRVWAAPVMAPPGREPPASCFADGRARDLASEATR